MAGFVLLCLGSLFLFYAPLAAKDAAGCKLVKGERIKLRSIVDGDTLVLADGRQVRLVGMQAPKLPLGRKDFPTWPLAPEAAAKLSALTNGQMINLKYGGTRIDRHGRVLAQLFLDDGTWVQRAMIEAGLARHYSFSDNRKCATELLAAEHDARAAKRGIWALPYYAIRDARDAALLTKDLGSFQVVEGRVHDATLIRGRLYLNFGSNWREDFTVTVPPAGVKLFAKGAWAEFIAEPARLAGRAVRVRGWIDSFNGPQIEASHPEQIELLD